MKRAFIYKDEKSHKFWWIDYSDCEFAVNYGKFGSIGKFEIKEFDTEEECLKQVVKLIRSKEKKGYVEDTGFDFMNRIYIDSEEYGLHPKTSHPRFTKHFTEEFYYDCTDEEAPFGSDEGNDTLGSLEEAIQERGVKAIKRLALLWGDGLTEIQSKMIDDLLSFPIDKDWLHETNR